MLARTLESNGAKVYITGRRKEKLDEAAKLAVSIHPWQTSDVVGSRTASRSTAT